MRRGAAILRRLVAYTGRNLGALGVTVTIPSSVSAFLRLFRGKKRAKTAAIILGVLLVVGVALTMVYPRRSRKEVHNTPFTLRVAVMKQRGGKVSVLKNGETMTSEDAYGVLFKPAQESF